MSGPAEIDEREFEEWYLVAHPKILAALTAYSSNASEASEATDEAFARALLKWDRLQTASRTAWVFIVGRNLIRRRQWRRHLEHERWQKLAARAPLPPDDAGPVTDASEIAQLLKPLSGRQMILHHGLDLSQAEVASLMRVSRLDRGFHAR